MTQILRAGRNAWKTVAPAEAGLLVDADDYFRAFYSAVHRAERYILMSGWQFDSGVPLLRGRDVPAGADVRFLKCLNGLCEAKPDLQIYILACNFHVAFALEREWMQRVFFHWLTSSRFRFLFDDCPVSGGSHHEIRGCRRAPRVPGRHGCLRVAVGRPPAPRGEPAASQPRPAGQALPRRPGLPVRRRCGRRASRALRQSLGARRGGDPLALHAPSEGERRPDLPSGAIVIGDAPVAFSRTDPRAPGEEIVEVEQLFLDAIDAAERLIYLARGSAKR